MKHLKRFTAALLVLALCCALSGCRALNEWRRNQVIRESDSTLVCDGKTYRLLEDMRASLFTGSMTPCFITQADVPVLLISLFGEEGLRSREIIAVQNQYYAEASCYDQYNREPLLDQIGVISYLPDPDDFEFFTEVLTVLDSDVQAALNDAEKIEDAPQDVECVEELLACDANALFTMPLFSLMADADGHYYRFDDISGEIYRFSETAEAVIARWLAAR